ncbi:unnamed protein product, partial [Symbiodinium sp. KB8]
VLRAESQLLSPLNTEMRYSRDRRVAGPVSEPCLAYVDPPVEASAKIFCTISAVRLLASFSLPGTADPAVTLCQWRFGGVRQVETDGSLSWSPVETWQPLPRKRYPRETDTGWSFGEEDGLELGRFYVFSVRLGDGLRYSAWSASSAAVLFDLPEAVLPVPAPERFGLPKHLANSEMLVESLGSGSVRCWWPHVQGPVLPSIDGTTQGRPPVEYRLDVSRCLDNGGLERHATVLLEDEEVLEEIGDDGEQSRAARMDCSLVRSTLLPWRFAFWCLAVASLADSFVWHLESNGHCVTRYPSPASSHAQPAAAHEMATRTRLNPRCAERRPAHPSAGHLQSTTRRFQVFSGQGLIIDTKIQADHHPVLRGS